MIKNRYYIVQILIICWPFLAESRNLGFSADIRQLARLEIESNGGISAHDLLRMGTKCIESPYLSADLKAQVLKELSLSSLESLPEGPELLSSLEGLKYSTLIELVTTDLSLDYYEIPLSSVSHQIYMNHGQPENEFFFFEKNGETYLRLFLHPLSKSTVYEGVLNQLKKKGHLVNKLRSNSRALFTSSSSLFVFDPDTSNEFSLKLPNQNAMGKFTEFKDLKGTDIEFFMQHEEHISNVEQEWGFENLGIMHEVLGVGLYTDLDFMRRNHEDYEQQLEGGLGTGMMVRSLKKKNNNRLVSLSSVLSESFGIELARGNGYIDTKEFVEQHVFKPLARAMAELYIKTGYTHDSPHSQNFLMELDSDSRPTGRIFLRDFNLFVDEIYQKEIQLELEHAQLKSDGSVEVALMHGMRRWPSWMDMEVYTDLNFSFYEEFKKHFNLVTGATIPFGELNQSLLYGNKHHGIAPVRQIEGKIAEEPQVKRGEYFSFIVDSRGHQAKQMQLLNGSEKNWRDIVFENLNRTYRQRKLSQLFPSHLHAISDPLGFISAALTTGKLNLISELPKEVKAHLIRFLQLKVRQRDAELMEAIETAVKVAHTSHLEHLVDFVFTNIYDISLEGALLKLIDRANEEVLQALTYKVFSRILARNYQKALVKLANKIDGKAIDSFLKFTIKLGFDHLREPLAILIGKMTEEQRGTLLKSATENYAQDIVELINQKSQPSEAARLCLPVI